VLPPGHFNLFGQFISERDGHTLDQDVQMFFALTNAIHDGAIAAWEAKRHYDYVRPITAVHYLKAGTRIRAWMGPGLGTGTLDGAGWRPFQPTWFPTPPFPEYVSGHSTFSAAGAEILARFTGSDAFGASVTVGAGSLVIESSVPQQPVTLSWGTFSQAADEAGRSRIYGGIHFNDGDIEGRKLGRLVATNAWNKAQTYINGSATP
jgi:PAP2 superfamily